MSERAWPTGQGRGWKMRTFRGCSRYIFSSISRGHLWPFLDESRIKLELDRNGLVSRYDSRWSPSQRPRFLYTGNSLDASGLDWMHTINAWTRLSCFQSRLQTSFSRKLKSHETCSVPFFSKTKAVQAPIKLLYSNDKLSCPHTQETRSIDKQ